MVVGRLGAGMQAAAEKVGFLEGAIWRLIKRVPKATYNYEAA
jgi:hypothetical protein